MAQRVLIAGAVSLRTRPADRRRADHGPGRHRAGRGAGPAARAAGRAEHGRHPGDPQLRGGGGPLRPGVGHAERPASSRRIRSATSSPTRSTRTPRRCSARSSRRQGTAMSDARYPPASRSQSHEHSPTAPLLDGRPTWSSSTPARGSASKPFRALKGVIASTSGPARPSAWSASPAPARPRSGRAVLGLAPVTGGQDPLQGPGHQPRSAARTGGR